MQEFSPRLDILPAAQRRLWDEFSGVPEEFVLYGGTAVALHLGHRHSIDFDFFGDRAFDPSVLETGISFLGAAKIVQRERNTLSAVVDRGGRVKVSFFGVPNLPRLGFGDGNLHTLTDDVKHRLVVAAREVDLEHLPDIARATRESDLDYGL